MSDTDLMNESSELRELRESVSGIVVAERPRLEAITGRGRDRRRRRVVAAARLSVVGAVAATAIAVTLTGVHGRAPALGTIRTASFTLHKNANGTATLTINPKELLDPTALQNDLAQYNIPAKVTVGSFCSSDPAPAGLSRVVSTQPPGEYTAQAGPVANPTMTIDPSAMPSGTELSVGDFQFTSGEFAGEQQADMDLIDTSSYTCTSTPRTLGPGTPGFGLLYGGHSAS